VEVSDVHFKLWNIELSINRKKFRKMKVKFDRKMEESNALYRDEQKALHLARRLQEQNEYSTIYINFLVACPNRV